MKVNICLIQKDFFIYMKTPKISELPNIYFIRSHSSTYCYTIFMNIEKE